MKMIGRSYLTKQVLRKEGTQSPAGPTAPGAKEPTCCASRAIYKTTESAHRRNSGMEHCQHTPGRQQSPPRMQQNPVQAIAERSDMPRQGTARSAASWGHAVAQRCGSAEPAGAGCKSARSRDRIRFASRKVHPWLCLSWIEDRQLEPLSASSTCTKCGGPHAHRQAIREAGRWPAVPGERNCVFHSGWH